MTSSIGVPRRLSDIPASRRGLLHSHHLKGIGLYTQKKLAPKNSLISETACGALFSDQRTGIRAGCRQRSLLFSPYP